VVVGDNVGMFEGVQNGEFGVKLFSLFLGHLDVLDFLPA